MPKGKVTYTCNICGKEYMKLEKAEECEQSHKVPESVDKPEYDPHNRKCRFPASVLVHFADGGMPVRYYRREKTP